MKLYQSEKYKAIEDKILSLMKNQIELKADIIDKLSVVNKETDDINKNIAMLCKNIDKKLSNQIRKDDMRLIEELLRLSIANNFLNDIDSQNNKRNIKKFNIDALL